jgi:hypothetical protein
MRGSTDPKRYKGICEPIQRNDMHTRVINSLPFIFRMSVCVEEVCEGIAPFHELQVHG